MFRRTSFTESRLPGHIVAVATLLSVAWFVLASPRIGRCNRMPRLARSRAYNPPRECSDDWLSFHVDAVSVEPERVVPQAVRAILVGPNRYLLPHRRRCPSQPNRHR